MRILLIYCVIAIIAIVMSVFHHDQQPGIGDLLAVIVCQPWLLVAWVLASHGVIAQVPELSAFRIAALSGLNILLWAIYLYRIRGRRSERA
jgi:hypothetical protein